MEFPLLLGSVHPPGVAPLSSTDRVEFDFVEAGRALRRFFQSRGLPEPEDAAQEALASLLRKFEEKAIDNPDAYLKGIARNMVREYYKLRQAAPIPAVPSPTGHNERMLSCLERCEKRLLSAAERRLLRDWYSGEGGEKIEGRKRLAVQQGITVDTLKTRVYRLRQKLAPCVRKCLEVIEGAKNEA